MTANVLRGWLQKTKVQTCCLNYHFVNSAVLSNCTTCQQVVTPVVFVCKVAIS